MNSSAGHISEWPRPDTKIQKCDRKECITDITLQKVNYEYVYKIMYTTACGYRNKYSNFIQYYFCSEECKTQFKKYCVCHKCNEDCSRVSEGTFIEKLGYTLCNSRGDMEPPCISVIASCDLEKRFAQEYKKVGYYKVDNEVIEKLLRDNDDLLQLIAANGYMISYNMLKDMYIFHTESKVCERENEDSVDEETFYEYYNRIKDELL
jgi:hypothetical protein